MSLNLMDHQQGRQATRKLLYGPFTFTGTMIEDLVNLVGKMEDQAQVQNGIELNNSPAGQQLRAEGRPQHGFQGIHHHRGA
jgi:hypothetical protein